MSALETRDLSKDFAGFRAVDRVSIVLDDGKVHALVGPNGAGKTTLFHMLTGFVRPSAGTIHAFGLDVTGLPPYRISRMGVVAELADRVIVMQQGRVIADGPYERVRGEPAVITAYLGQTDA